MMCGLSILTFAVKGACDYITQDIVKNVDLLHAWHALQNRLLSARGGAFTGACNRMRMSQTMLRYCFLATLSSITTSGLMFGGAAPITACISL
jgi:hypothetical protein